MAYKASVKSMAIYLKIPYYFYTNLNFQRPISCLILIWNPLKFYNFWTLQIKLSKLGRSTHQGLVSLATVVWQNCQQTYPQGLVSLTELPCGRTTGRSHPQGSSVWQNCCVAEMPADLRPRMSLRTKMTIPYFNLLYLIKKMAYFISVKSMAIYLKIPNNFYTNLNFQRPISHLILILDPLKF